MGAYDRARSTVLRTKHRLRSWISVAPFSGLPDDDVRPLLRHWGIDAFKVTHRTGGAAPTGFCIETPTGRYILRRITTGRAHVEHMLRVMEHLTAHGFPYDVPQIVPTPDAARYVAEGPHHWILYRFVEGTRAAPLSTAARARSLGRLVASYDRTIETLEFEHGRFRLPLFDSEQVATTLTDATPSFQKRRGLATAFADHASAMIATLHTLLPASLATVAELPTITAYYDWHRFNIIDRGGALAGLIDYDSIVEAPRIVDVQSALTYVLLSKKTPDLRLASAFLEGYSEFVRLSRRETSLVYPVWLDRIAWLVADIVGEVRRAGTSTREPLGYALLGLFSWVTAHEAEIANLLNAYATIA
jgi:homoserine kinase type II